jgi:hypothetical protein
VIFQELINFNSIINCCGCLFIPNIPFYPFISWNQRWQTHLLLTFVNFFFLFPWLVWLKDHQFINYKGTMHVLILVIFSIIFLFNRFGFQFYTFFPSAWLSSLNLCNFLKCKLKHFIFSILVKPLHFKAIIFPLRIIFAASQKVW